MNSKIFIVMKNHARVAKNWFSLLDNLCFSILLLTFFVVLLILFRQRLHNSENTSILKTAVGPMVLLFTIYITNLYLSVSKGENKLLLTAMSKNELKNVKRVQAVISSVVLYFVFQALGLIAQYDGISNEVVVLCSVILLIFVSIIMGSRIGGAKYKLRNVKNERSLRFSASYHKANPVRAIVLRNLLSIWRKKRMKAILYILSLMVINVGCLLLSIRNHLETLYYWSFIVQVITLIDPVLNSSIDNDVKLLKMNRLYMLDALKGNLIFWMILCYVYLSLILPVYYMLLPNISVIYIMLLCFSLIVLLAYTVMIRLVFCEHHLLRNIIMIFSIILPITIPFFIYRSYRRLKCCA